MKMDFFSDEKIIENCFEVSVNKKMNLAKKMLKTEVIIKYDPTDNIVHSLELRNADADTVIE